MEAYKDLPDAIPCGLASCHTPHKNGYVVAFITKEGERGEGHIGHVCGGKAFGLTTWTDVVRAHETKVQLAAQAELMADKVAQCRDIEPHIPALHEVASLVYNARSALQIDFPDLFKVCEAASRRFGGMISGDDYQTRKPFQVRLAHREFWMREDIGKRVSRLQGDIRLFLARAPQCTKAKEQSSLLTALGSPRDEAKRLLTAVTNDIQALYSDHLAAAVLGYRALSGARDVRVRERFLERFNDGYGYTDPKWVLHTDLSLFPRLAKSLAQLSQALELKASIRTPEVTEA